MRPDPDPAREGYEVLDARGRTVGPATGYWLDDETGEPLFACVKARLRGHHRLVPLHRARFDDRARQLRVPYVARDIRHAPSHPADLPLTHGEGRVVLAHYGEPPEGRLMRPGDVVPDIPLHEEHVEVGTRVVRAGAVRLRKVVRTRIEYRPVEVRYEEFVLERIPEVDAPADASAATLPSEAFQGGEVVLREHAEEPVFTKHAEVVGGVRARRVVERFHEDVPTQLRREDMEIDRGPARRDDRT